MKKRVCIFLHFLICPALLLAAIGGYLKYGLFPAVGMETQESVISLPFVLMKDQSLIYSLSHQREATEPTEATEMPTQMPTQPETEAATEPVPETERAYVEVDESWFDDALFIGESRVANMRGYYRLGEADYFCDVNQTVYTIAYTKLSDTHFAGWTLRQVLSYKSYGKIILQFGINETAGEADLFISAYEELIQLIQELQPDAIIMLHSVMPVTEGYRDRAYFKPDHLDERSRLVQELAEKYGCYYIDSREWCADEDGWLLPEYTRDGCHPNYDGCEKWAAWLVEKAYLIENGLI